MIVEVFLRNSKFQEFFDTFYNIKNILVDNDKFILIIDKYGTKPNIVLDAYKYELRVIY